MRGVERTLLFLDEVFKFALLLLGERGRTWSCEWALT